MVDTIDATVNDVSPTPEPLPTPPPSHPPLPASTRRALVWLSIAVVLLLSVASVVMAWRAQQRVHNLEQELVRRQQNSQGEANEAKVLAKQAQDTSRDAAAKVALLDMRLGEVALQRTQLEDLIQSLSRSRDENVLVDIEAAIRVALQQSAITGSAEPMVAALRQSDERLARLEQPRFEPVRRALARDLDKVRAVGIADLSTLTIKLDEAARMVDELPLLSAAESHRGPGGSVSAASVAAAPASQAKPPAAAASASAWPAWMLGWSDTWAAATERVWDEARSLVRVTHIEHPEGMLMSPEQGFFLRENLKLRLLNARLALLSRQYDTVQSDLRSANVAIDRYFDRRSRKTMLASELIQQVAGQARAVNLPRPDDTLAALAASTAVR